MDAEPRREWMSVLAKAGLDELEAAWAGLPARPAHRPLRPAETGMVMVRGRAGGTGARFNLGEMTVTRCAVEVAGRVGLGYVAGRSARRAELAALLDGVLQDDAAARRDLREAVLAPLRQAQAGRRAAAEAEAASSRVEFFTMVRGENA